jgi:hypothetical protein
MNFKQFLDLHYLFNKYPPVGFSNSLRITLWMVFILLIIIAILAGRKSQKLSGAPKKAWRKLQIWGWISGPVGLLLIICRELGAIYITARFWLLLWLLITIIWLIFIILYRLRKVPSQEKLKKEQAEFSKWLPRKK